METQAKKKHQMEPEGRVGWSREDFLADIMTAEELTRQRKKKKSFQYHEGTPCAGEIQVAKSSCHVRLQIWSWGDG